MRTTDDGDNDVVSRVPADQADNGALWLAGDEFDAGTDGTLSLMTGAGDAGTDGVLWLTGDEGDTGTGETLPLTTARAGDAGTDLALRLDLAASSAC